MERKGEDRKRKRKKIKEGKEKKENKRKKGKERKERKAYQRKAKHVSSSQAQAHKHTKCTKRKRQGRKNAGLRNAHAKKKIRRLLIQNRSTLGQHCGESQRPTIFSFSLFASKKLFCNSNQFFASFLMVPFKFFEVHLSWS